VTIRRFRPETSFSKPDKSKLIAPTQDIEPTWRICSLYLHACDAFELRRARSHPALPTHISSLPSWQCTVTSFASPKLDRGLQGAEGGRKASVMKHESECLLCIEYLKVMIINELCSGEGSLYLCPYSLLPGNKVLMSSDLDSYDVHAMQETV
jgi:hypothetical protein